jgi:hypothetical protein
MERKFDGKMSHEETFNWLNPGLPHDETYNRKRLLSTYIEITEETYWYFLEVLPPMNWRNGYFAIVEATTDDVRLGIFKIGERYFAAHVSDDEEPHKLAAVAEQIRAAIKEAA